MVLFAFAADSINEEIEMGCGVIRLYGTFVERGSLGRNVREPDFTRPMAEIEIAWRLRDKRLRWRNFFASAHLVIIWEWKSAHAGRNSGRKLKRIQKDYEIT